MQSSNNQENLVAKEGKICYHLADGGKEKYTENTTPSLRTKSLPSFIYITGCDGTGKSTQASLLVDALTSRGIRPRRLWLRFPFVFSIPLLAYARLRGFSWYEQVAGVRHGYWDFHLSWLLKTIFPWLLLLDAALASIVKIYLPILFGRTIVCERFVIDMLVDLSLATRDRNLHKRLPGRTFKSLLPKDTSIILLDLDVKSIRARRPDLITDCRLEDRLETFRHISDDLDLRIFSSSTPMHELNRSILQHLDQQGADSHSSYAKFNPVIMGKLLSYPIVALASHWLFQSLFYMDRTERLFKLSLELVLTLIVFGFLSLRIHWFAGFLLAFIIAHTVNFLFNGHIWGVLKHYNLNFQDRESFNRYVQNLIERAGNESALGSFYIVGSLSREEWSPKSDLDARIIRYSGFFKGVRACWFALCERSRALFCKFPLDLYILDHPASLRRHNIDESASEVINLLPRRSSEKYSP
jgi:hypothetical protein